MKIFLLGVLNGAIFSVLIYHYRGWILAKLGITFPPKAPPN